MHIRSIMSTPAITVSEEMEIRAVARVMRTNQISSVPVVDTQGVLLGAITELDLIARNAPLREPQYIAVLSALIPVDFAKYREYKEQLRQAIAVNAGELMQTDVHSVAPNTTIEDALKLMLDPECILLPVVEDGKVIGVVTRTDMVRLIEELEMSDDDREEDTGG